MALNFGVEPLPLVPATVITLDENLFIFNELDIAA